MYFMLSLLILAMTIMSKRCINWNRQIRCIYIYFFFVRVGTIQSSIDSVYSHDTGPGCAYAHDRGYVSKPVMHVSSC